MAASVADPCTFCGGPDGLVAWRRTSPDLLRARACLACHAALAAGANQTARTWDEGVHLTQQASALGGEVWTAQGIDYWFKHPVSLGPAFSRAAYHAGLPRQF